MTLAVFQRTTAVVENVRLARDTYRVRLACPEIAARIVPGQFVMLRLADVNDPLLGRPFALYDTVLDSNGTPLAITKYKLVAADGSAHRLVATDPNFDTLVPPGVPVTLTVFNPLTGSRSAPFVYTR